MEPSIKATKPLVRGGKKKKKRAADAELSALVEACGAAAPSAKRKKKQRKLSPPTAPHPAAGGQAATALAAKYAWDTDYGDHFETSEQAFRDVAPALRALCGAGAGAAILDPYYCDGAAETRLRALGFRNATNPATDFYASRAYREPGDRSTFDALVTNRAYERVIQRRFNVGVLYARVPEKPSTRRDRSERRSLVHKSAETSVAAEREVGHFAPFLPPR